MCSFTAAMGIVGFAGSMMQGISGQQAAYAQAEAISRAGEANARIAEINAGISEQQATDAVKRGGEQEERIRRHVASIVGRQRAAAAASGLSPDSGSALDARNSSMLEGERDAVTNALNHARQAWGFGVDASNYKYQAAIERTQGAAGAAAARAQGDSAFIGGLFGGASSLLSMAAPTAAYRGSNTIALGDGGLFGAAAGTGAIYSPVNKALQIAAYVPR